MRSGAEATRAHGPIARGPERGRLAAASRHAQRRTNLHASLRECFGRGAAFMSPKVDREYAPGAGQVADAQGASECLDTLPCDGESQAQSTSVAMSASERGEHHFDSPWRNPATPILHVDCDCIVVAVRVCGEQHHS